MKDYILETMHGSANGLYMCELPTGYGKTYRVVQAMKEYVSDAGNKKKLIYLTTLNKNLPEDELKAAFGDDIVYRQKVLRIRSNFDEVTEKIADLSIPEAFQTAAYRELYKAAERYNRAVNEKAADREYIQELKQRVDDAERQFRGEVTRRLHKFYSSKKARLKAIKTDSQWQWLGVLYPAVFTDEHQILLMSISKFMKRNTTFIEKSYAFLKSDMLKNAIIFMDEFDAAKTTIENEIIDKAFSFSEDYLGLFRQILTNLNPEYWSKTMKRACDAVENDGEKGYTLDVIIKEARYIEQRYRVNLSFKTIGETIDRRQYFLLKDATYHTLCHEDKTYIRTAVNNEENRVDIFFEDAAAFYANKEHQDMVVYSLLREVNRFLNHFKLFVYACAGHYMDIVNEAREPDDDAMTLENAVSSILSKLGFGDKQKELIFGEFCQTTVHSKQKACLPDNSFYQRGLELFEFEDSDLHHDSTTLRLIEVHDTPEKIIACLAENAVIFGISATAEVGSVIGNYYLLYLQEKLGEDYHPTPIRQKQQIRGQLENQWQAYADGRIRIHTEVVQNQMDLVELENYLEDILENDEIARICMAKIKLQTAKAYAVSRYCNLMLAMKRFILNEQLQSFLYLGMALPQKNNQEFEQDLIQQLFAYVKSMAASDIQKNTDLVILKGDSYAETKEMLTARLSRGERIFIISSYQTIGAGQNLQYLAPDKSGLIELVPDTGNGDKRHEYKDIDGLYLGEITNMVVNIYRDEKIDKKELLKMIFQIEELKQNSELNFQDSERMVKLAFQSHVHAVAYEKNDLYKMRSVRLQANRHVMQAVGRMCRTFLKNQDVCVMIEQKLLVQLLAGELKTHILTPEMAAIVKLREQLGKEHSCEEKHYLNQAEKTASFGMWDIRQILAHNWTEDSMRLWEELRQLVLTMPTASEEQWKKEALIHRLYITSGKKQNQYLYSQYLDFRDVTIDFDMDKIGFRNSHRAKRKAETGEVLVYEMSEANSDLPTAMKYPELAEYFREQGYACRFEVNDYMMSPVLFHNIYKGALGEAAGRFILEKERGIHLKAITEPDRYEFFDFELAPDVYIDFKNWKFTYLQEREKVKKEIDEKMVCIGAKRVYVINLVGDGNFHRASAQVDGRIIEIPGLIDKEGRTISKNIAMIREEDIR